MGHTDFTSLNEFEDLLKGLERILFELMAHEEIENQFVMKKLKVKLKEDRTLEQNDLICNCHKEDRFTPLQNLFRDGYAFIRRGNADRISYQIKLHKVIKQFYEDFLPHMHEEENVMSIFIELSFLIDFVLFIEGHSTVVIEIFYRN